MKEVYIQTAETLEDFEYLLNRVTNMLEGQDVVNRAARVIGDGTPTWKRNFCEKYLSRFSGSECYRILMGQLAPDHRQYHYVPNPW